MTLDELLQAMRELCDLNGDPEIAHSMADGLLCEALQLLAGEQGKVVEEIISTWGNVPKLYA